MHLLGSCSFWAQIEMCLLYERNFDATFFVFWFGAEWAFTSTSLDEGIIVVDFISLTSTAASKCVYVSREWSNHSGRPVN